MAERAIRRTVNETPAQRADRLLHQSFLDDVIVKLLSNGTFAMRSAHTVGGVWYLVTESGCTCPWGQQNPGSPCKHSLRAAFENSFTKPPSPAAPAVLVRIVRDPVTVACELCSGTGKAIADFGTVYCPVCEGSGEVEPGIEPTDDEPTPRPAFACLTCRDTGVVTKQNRYRQDLTYRAACPSCRPSLVAVGGGRFVRQAS